jgi:hypothetical protein
LEENGMKKIMSFTTAVLLFAVSSVFARPAVEVETPSGSGPLVTGPIKGGEMGYPFGAYFGDIRNIGYVEEEYFIEGTAARYAPMDELKIDGKWNIEPVSAAPYKTRILVRRPRDPAKFNGTVVVEWINVSAGYDNSMGDPPGLYGNGFAYVSVSAQPTGIEGFPSLPRGLKAWDKERYGSLYVPDEAVSFDIFTQAARTIGPKRKTESHGADPMGGLEVKKLIATGASQSGSRILAYLNGVQPLSNAFDGFIPVINAGSASDFASEMAHPDSGTGDTSHSRSIRTRVRGDLDVPVLQFNSQTESLYYAGQRQDETDTFRSWEIAGSSHMPYWMAQLSRRRTDRDGMTNTINAWTTIVPCEPDWFYVLDAAFLWMHKWVNGGPPPPQMPPVQVDGRDYAYDQYGNVRGGIRLPEVEVPTAKYVAGPSYPLGGYTLRFSPEELRKLYPAHDDYVAKITAAAYAARDAGVILPERAEEYIKAAQVAPIPEPVPVEAKTQIRANNEGRTTR